MRNQIVVLAGGKGTRMGTGDVPKVLVMLKNKPLILYLLHEIEKINQLVKPVIVVGYKAKEVIGVLGEDYIYAIQREQLGTADALKTALQKVTAENILVLNGDHPFTKAESLKKLMTLHHKKQSNISMLVSLVPDFEGEYALYNHFGRVIRKDGKIVKVVEYKDAGAEQKEIKEINPNIYMFNTQWLRANIGKINNNNAQREYYLTDIVGIAISGGEAIEFLEIDAKEVLGVNSREDLKLAESMV